MKKHVLGLFAGSVAACLMGTCLGFASSSMKDHKTNVNFYTTAKFQNGDVLPAGTYQMQVPENTQTPEVTFSTYGKVVATVPARVVSEANKNPETQVISDTTGSAQLVKSIEPSGWRETLIFNANGNPSGQANSAPAAE